MEEKKREIAAINADIVRMKMMNPINVVCRSSLERTCTEVNEMRNKLTDYSVNPYSIQCEFFF